MLRLHFLNVENGDCIILEHETYAGVRSFGVVDCNRTPSRLSPAKDKLLELGAENVSFVCITHPDKDHFTGIYDVLTQFRGRIGSFYTYPLGSTLADKELLKKYFLQIAEFTGRGGDPDIASRYSELMQIFQEAYSAFYKRNEWYELTGDYSRMAPDGFNGVEIHGIMPPKQVKGEIVQSIMNDDPKTLRTLDRNGISSAILLKYRGKTVVLGGDATADNWQAHKKFRERAPDVSINSDVVKLPHHGSKRDNKPETLEDFFAASTSTPVAVISANGRSHPSVEIFSELNRLGCVRLCTNLFAGKAEAIKRLHLDPSIDKRLIHQLNVFADIRPAKVQPCRGDIMVTIANDGTVSYETQYKSLCGCHVEAFVAQAHAEN